MHAHKLQIMPLSYTRIVGVKCGVYLFCLLSRISTISQVETQIILFIILLIIMISNILTGTPKYIAKIIYLKQRYNSLFYIFKIQMF